VPFKVEHAHQIALQKAQADMRELIDVNALQSREGSMAYTALEGDEVLACGGIIDVWPGRGLGWMFLSQNAGRRMLSITRAVKRAIEAYPLRRIEITVDDGFENGHQWARMLGFRLETPEPMKGYMPDGRAAFQYALTLEH